MDTMWTITEFNLTKLVFWRRASLRERAVVTAVVFVPVTIFVLAFVFKEYWTLWFGWVGPWLAGFIILTFVAVAVAGIVERAKEKIGSGAAFLCLLLTTALE